VFEEPPEVNAPQAADQPQAGSEGQKGSFVPEQYKPAKATGVQLLDRGESEPGDRYVLRHPESGAYLTISGEDLRLWEMFDGERSAQDVLEEYVKNYKTVPLDRLVRLIRDLWDRGFLLSDPGFYTVDEKGQECPVCAFCERVHDLRKPIPGLEAIPSALGRIGLARLFAKPVVWLLSAVLAWGLVMLIFEGRQVMSSMWGYMGMVSSPAKIVVLFVLLNFLFSFVRELCKGLLVAGAGVEVSAGGLRLRWGVPLFYFDVPMLLAQPRRRRLKLRGSGLWVDALLLALVAGAWYARQGFANDVVFASFLVLALRVILATCPFMSNELYLTIGDALDELGLRRRTLGFVKRNFGRTIPTADLKACLPYLGFGLFCVLWADLILSVCHCVLTTRVQNSRAGALFAALAIGVPVVIVAGSIIAWGSRILAEGCKQRDASEGSQASAGVTELAGLALIMLFILVLPGTPKKVFSLNIVFLTLLAVYYSFFNLLKHVGGGRPSRRYVILLLWAQVLWLPLLGIFYDTLLRQQLPLPWAPLAVFAVIAAAYVVVACAMPDFLKRGPVLGLSEGLVWLSIPVLLLCTADVVRVGQARGALACHPFTYSGLVLGAGLIFLGFHIPAQFLKGSPATAQPYPFSTGKANSEKLEKAFCYFVATLFDTVLTSFSPKSLSVLKRDYNALTKQAEADVSALDPDTHFEHVGIQPQQYGAFFRAVDGILVKYCGKPYVECVFGKILGQIHWDSRTLLLPLVNADKAPAEKPVADQEESCSLVQSVHVFRKTEDSEAALRSLASCMEYVRFERGDAVVAQGGLCDALYLVADGVGQSEEWDITGQMVIGAYLQKGDIFGESSLLPDEFAFYTFTIRALQPMSVGRIKKTDFEAFCEAFPKAGEQIRNNVTSMEQLREMPFFKELSPSLASFLLTRIQYSTHKPGDVLITQGEVGHEFYIIKKGKVDVVVEREGRKDKLAELSVGDYFGEIALLTDAPRNATVTAIEDLEVGVVQKDDFLSLRSGSKEFGEGLETIVKKRLDV